LSNQTKIFNKVLKIVWILYSSLKGYCFIALTFSGFSGFYTLDFTSKLCMT